MKRTLIAAVAMCLLPSMGRAKGMASPEASEKTVVADSVQEQIRKELETIRALQVDISSKREEAVKAKLHLDSLQHKTPDHDLSTDYGVMAQIEDNTHKDNLRDGWNMYGIFALAVAIISLIVSIKTFTSQSGTERNTKKLSQDAQRDLLCDMLRHLYRNFVITYAMRTKTMDESFEAYPSEEHFEKLKVPMENIHLEVFYGHDREYTLMHNLYLNLRNYNEEVGVARLHICSRDLTPQTKNEDFDLLEFKITYLTRRIIYTIGEIWGLNDRSLKVMRTAMDRALDKKTNANDNIPVEGCEDFEHKQPEVFDFYERLYNEAERRHICDCFNRDVCDERKLNSRQARKIRMIRF